MPRPRPARAAAAVASALALLALGACGDDPEPSGGAATSAAAPATDAPATTGGDDGEATTTTEDAAEATSTTSATAGGDDDPEGIDDLESLAQSLLVQPGEIDTETLTFEDTGYVPPDEGGVNACGNPLTDSVVPPAVLVGTTLTEPTSGLQLLQEIRIYADEAEAGEAFDTGVEALGCGTSADGALTLDGPIDVTEEVGGDRASAFDLEAPETEGVLVAVHLSDSVVLFLFTGSVGAAESVGAGSPLDVAAFGVGKILAALGE